MHACAFVYVHMCRREMSHVRERVYDACTCVCVYACTRVRACVYACTSVCARCEHARVYAHVYMRVRENCVRMRVLLRFKTEVVSL